MRCLVVGYSEPAVLWVFAYVHTGMARKQRVNFSLAPDVVDKLDEIPDGDRSTFVERAVRETELPEEYVDA
jgi:hypothetical protein